MLRWPSLSPAMIYPLLDWFMPAEIRNDSATLQRARMFLISHLFGPFLGHTITVYLFILEPAPDQALAILAAAITVFWAFPFVLRYTGWFTLLGLLSVQNLIFAILWGCYHYGGVSSPFLPWLLTVPLLAFFYLGPGPKLRLMILGIIAVNLLAFYLIYESGHSFPEHIALQSLSGIGIISTLCAAGYVSMMALYYANIVASQTELEHEVQRHLATARQLRAAKLEAERGNRAKSEFLAKISHELRTPLNAVIGYSEMLLEDAEAVGHDEQADDIRKINGAGKQLLGLVSDVLDLSKLEAGRMELYVEKFLLAAVLDDVIEQARPAIEANGNRLALDAPADLGTVESDAAKLRQATLYLMNNAGKFTHDGCVTLSGRREDGWIVISVRDTGVGIRPDDIGNLFENFREAEGATSSKYGSTGLGLALCRKICSLMGGDVSVESTLGVGSCFTIRVPERVASPDRDEAPATDAARRPSDHTDARATILVIDDDPTDLELLQRILGKAGFTPVVAESALEGLELARQVNPSLIFLDILMPGTDGWGALRVIKADATLRDCPVVLLSVSDDVQKGRALGAAEHLLKPIDRDALLRTVARLLQESSARAGAKGDAARGNPTDPMSVDRSEIVAAK